jgi:hypothetical protein
MFKNPYPAVAILCLLFSGAFFCLNWSPAANSVKATVEYKLVAREDFVKGLNGRREEGESLKEWTDRALAQSTSRFNEYGADGWQLCSQDDIHLVFCRASQK